MLCMAPLSAVQRGGELKNLRHYIVDITLVNFIEKNV